MFSMVLFNIFINYLGKDVKSTFVYFIEAANFTEVFSSTLWTKNNLRETTLLNRMVFIM